MKNILWLCGKIAYPFVLTMLGYLEYRWIIFQAQGFEQTMNIVSLVFQILSFLAACAVPFILYKQRQNDAWKIAYEKKRDELVAQYEIKINEVRLHAERLHSNSEGRMEEMSRNQNENVGSLRAEMASMKESLLRDSHEAKLLTMEGMNSTKEHIIKAIADLQIFTMEHFATKAELKEVKSDGT